jgi:hypothetical protein
MQSDIMKNYGSGSTRMSIAAMSQNVIYLVSETSKIMEFWASDEGGPRFSAALTNAVKQPISRRNITKFTAMFGRMKTLIENMASNLDHMWNQSGIRDWTETSTKQVADHIGQVVEKYNQMSHDLCNLKSVDLDATLERLNTELSVRRQNLIIKDGNVNLTVNFEIKLLASDFAKSILAEKWVSEGDKAKEIQPYR